MSIALPSDQSKSFNGFYKPIASLFTYSGVAPGLTEDAPRPPSLRKLACGCGLIIYWTGVGFALARKGLPNNSVSIISNYIQLLLNALAFTVALVNPLWKYQDYHQLINLFIHIDHQLCGIQRAIEYRKHVKVFYAVTGVLLALICYNHGFNYYVNVVRNRSQVPYWILYSIPMPFYAISLHHAIVFIFCIHKRLQLASELLLPRKPSTKGHPNLIQIKEQETKAKVFQLINDIYLLCVKVDDFFGPVLLTALGALFTVTSIQSFYCLTISSDFNERNNRTIWSLFCCINLVVIGIPLVIALSCVSEMVMKDANRILTSVLQEQQNDQVSAI